MSEMDFIYALRRSLLLLLTSVVLLQTGCSESERTENVKTSDIFLGIELTSTDGEVVTAHVDMRSVENRIVGEYKLSDNDYFEFIHNSDSNILHSTNKIPYFTYGASLNLNSEEVLMFSYVRSQHVSAPKSTVFMPNDFNVTIDKDALNVYRDDTIIVEWSPALNSDNRNWYAVELLCETQDKTTDSYSYTNKIYNTNSLRSEDIQHLFQFIDSDNLELCNLEITVSTEAKGTRDENLGGGYITASQVRTLSIPINL